MESANRDRPQSFPAGSHRTVGSGRPVQGAGSAWFGWAVGLILLLGGGLRFIYIDHKVHHVDEQVAQAVVQGLEFPGQWDTNWGKTAMVSGFKYDQYNFSSYHYLLYGWRKVVALIDGNRADQLGALRAMNGWLGLFSLVGLAIVGRRLMGEMAGIAAAIAGALMPLWLEDAHYLRSETMLTAGVCGLLLLVTGRGGENPWRLFAGGLILGWLVACKATMGLAAPLLLWLMLDAVPPVAGRWKAWVILGSLMSFGVVIGVVVGVPFGVAQPQKYFSGLARLAWEYSMPMPPYTQPEMSASFPVALAYLKGTLGWGFGLVAVVGLIGLGSLNRWWRTVLLVAPVVLAAVVFGSHALFTERSYSPFLSILALLFGAGCQHGIGRVTRNDPARGGLRVVLAVLLVTMTLALPAIQSWQIVFRVFSGQEQIEKDAALARMKGNLQGKVVRMFNVAYHAENYRMIEAHLGNGEPVLVLLVDYYDTTSPTVLKALQQKYGGRILGVREGLFPDLPPCMLTTISSPRLWLLYIPAKSA